MGEKKSVGKLEWESYVVNMFFSFQIVDACCEQEKREFTIPKQFVEGS